MMIDEVLNVDPYILHQIVDRRQPAVVKIEFLNFRSKYPDGRVIAVEGDDDKVVYSCWIARLNSDLKYEFFVCGGKRGVRSLRNSLYYDRSDAGKELIFLVDRDFDDLDGFLTTDKVFILERYSVENYLVETCVVDESIKIAFPGHGNPGKRSEICDIFAARYLEFLEASKSLNRRIFFARKLKIDIDAQVPASLASIAEVRLTSINANAPSADETLQIVPEPSAEVAAELNAEFDKLDPAFRYRGKYALKFLVVWLEQLVHEFRDPKIGCFSPSQQSGSKIKHQELSLGALAYRSPIPEGFAQFLKDA